LEAFDSLTWVIEMQEDQNVESVASQLPEPDHLDRVAGVIQELLASDHEVEAMVRFTRLRAPDQADVMAQLPREFQARLLDRLTHQHLGEIIKELEPEEAVELSQHLGPEQFSQVLDEASPDVAADILRSLPKEVAARTLELMEQAEDVVPLLEFEDDEAGGLMTPDFIALRERMTMTQAMTFIRESAKDLDPEDISHLFVVDQNGVLKGGISVVRLLLARPTQHVSVLMRPDVISVKAETDQEECARIMKRYDLRNLPVVDEGSKLVGVLKLENMIDVLEEEATEDMYRMIGVDEEERAFGPIFRSVRNRLPWLYLYVGTAFVAAAVIGLFESTIEKVVVLAVFLNVAAGQGGQGGAQTVTLVVRSIALGEVSGRRGVQLLRRELFLGSVHGALLGVGVGLMAYLWKGSLMLGFILGVALLGNMVIGGLAGAGIPLLLRWLRMDPAVSSAVFVTTFTDVMGVLFYLGLATLLISFL
jgi:magnesium transporter